MVREDRIRAAERAVEWPDMTPRQDGAW